MSHKNDVILVGRLNFKMQQPAFISGEISEKSTPFLLLGAQLEDTSVTIALANLTILTVARNLLYNMWKRQIELQDIFLTASLTKLAGMKVVS